MAKTSAGLLLFRRGDAGIEVLLVHPGGPFWANKDEHAWSIPKGEYDERDDPAEAAEREFTEELGSSAPAGPRLDLGEVKQSNKTVRVWAVEADFDAASVVSNTFEMEWPPKSGTMRRFPEIDRAAWFPLDDAPSKLHKGQASVVTKLRVALATDTGV
ncbi:MAG: NUDIX domain-containing protein, partial [Acidimicrobiales bacterium]|nr:NUDIX domain-containing protein [Acidimicrobiales bacterium]